MRLINVKDYSITEFIGQNVPPYAILSHTWGDDEVSFQDMQNFDAARRKEGFKKIDTCCKQAKEDSLEWVWVDTCCIDKTSSAELSEAINSMFQWYSRSMLCYAFLNDVSISYDHRPEDLDLDAFQKSRWFTRGWTLQELLAPFTVEFFSSNWSYIGSKKQLAPLVSEITGIPVTILDHSKSPLNETAYQRMHWASKRQTTREEDMAYCLLGLFDVNLPLLYGEGKKAFYRLQEEILKQFNDHTTLIWDIHPTKGRLEGGEVPEICISAGLLAESPRQFSNVCDVKSLQIITNLNESIQISRKGSLMKLYLKKVTPNLASWRRYIPTSRSKFYLAALDCAIQNSEYITEPSIKNQYGHDMIETCTAMLLIRRFNGSYERILSYYETVDVAEVRAMWTYSSCYIENPIWQWDVLESFEPEDKVNVRWTGPTFGYRVIETSKNQKSSAFLLAQDSKSSSGLFIIVVCSLKQPWNKKKEFLSYDKSLLDVRWQENQS
jgi:hypothetical protein